MKRFRLKDTDSTKIKYDTLCKLADQLGLTFHFYAGMCILRDVERPNMEFYIEDIETGRYPAEICSFPHPTEVKIIWEKHDESSEK